MGKNCRRQFIENPQKKYISESRKEDIRKDLLEKTPLRGIARSLNISIKWLQQFVNNFYRSIPCEIKIKPEKTVDLVIECDEMWSYVCSKENQVYIWLAMDRNTRKIVGVHLGDRTRFDAEKLWKGLREKGMVVV